MNNTRIPVVIMTAALVSTAILALLTFQRTIQARASSPAASSMGDLHRYEAQQSSTPGGTAVKNHNPAGFGDLRRFEAGQAATQNDPTVGMGDLRRYEAEQAATRGKPIVGMGDLRRFEAGQNSAAGAVAVGMGDLRLFEAGQTVVAGNERGFRLADRVCPAMSTNSGERDAGASAPAVHLQAVGCLEQAGK